MSSIDLRFPVFIHVRFPDPEDPDGDRPQVHVRPLFDTGFHGEGRTLQDALRSCRGRIQSWFRAQDDPAQSQVRLPRLAFRPELHVQTVQLGFHLGRREHLEPVMVARFRVNGQTWGALPRVPGLVWYAGEDPSILDFLESTRHEVERRHRETRKGDPPLTADLLRARKGDAVDELDLSLAQPRVRFAFEERQDLWFFFGAQREFSGVREIAQVARDLLDDFPDRLLRAQEPMPAVEEVSRALYEGPSALVLLGPVGSGRTTAVHEAVHRRLAQARGVLEAEPKTWHLDPGRMVAGMPVIGWWQQRADAIFTWVESRIRTQHPYREGGPATDALFVDAPVALCHVGRYDGSALALSSVLRPWIENRRFTVIIEATPEEWQRVEEMDRPFADLFRRVRVEPATREQAIRILARRRASLEARRGVTFTAAALLRLMELEDRFPSGRAAPGRHVDRLEEIGAARTGEVNARTVDLAFSERSGLKWRHLDLEWPLLAADLVQELEQSLKGQPDAVAALTDAILSVRASLGAPGRPAGTLLFVGPTGVGKTEAARLLCRSLYNAESSLVRLDMNEYSDPGAVLRLMGHAGAPDGQLTRLVRHHPFCVLLLDEIEKAHPTVHDLLLQVLDEGRLTDGLARRVDFTHALIVMTSNVGARQIAHTAGFQARTGVQAAAWRAELARSFRPEFLNRVDRVVVFRELEASHIRAIADLQARNILLREGFLRRQWVVDLRPQVLDGLAAQAVDGRSGARSIKRVLERELSQLFADSFARHSDVHALFRVEWRDGRCVGTVRPLRLAAPRPRTDLGARTGAERLGLLQKRLEDLIDRLDQATPPSSQAHGKAVAWSSSDSAWLAPDVEIRERIRELAEEVQAAAAPPERLLRAPVLHVRRRKAPKLASEETAFGGDQARASHEPVDLWRAVARQYADGTPEAISPLVDLEGRATRLERAVDAWVSHGPVGVAIVIRNIGTHRSGAGSWLTRFYALEGSVDVTALPDGQGWIVLRHGLGLAEILQDETGIHLLGYQGGGVEGVHLDLVPLWDDGPFDPARCATLPRAGETHDTVIRLYTCPDDDDEHGFVKDPRTGCIVPWFDAIQRHHRMGGHGWEQYR